MDASIVAETLRRVSSLLSETSSGLWCAAGRFHIDPWRPVERAVITHAHGDHARPGNAHYLCARRGLPVLRTRMGPEANIEAIGYGETRELGGVKISLHPAGHVLGSSQVRVEHRGEVWVVTGDYKRQADPTCRLFEPVSCHTLVTEATFALPIYTWDATAAIVDDIVSWWHANREQERPSIIFCYV